MATPIKEIVKQKYTEIAQAACGCGPCCSSDEISNFSENYKQLDGYVPEADLQLGCGIPTDIAQIKPGDTVLDLGSGAGNDVFVARQLTGATGKVIGVDMTIAMIEKARANQAKLGFHNVEFHLGEIEQLPLETNSIDVAISNCVMNLVPDKAKAYQEVHRVLRPGGHFSISDIVLQGELPQQMLDLAILYTGCVAGAMQKEAYLQTIKAAGFETVEVPKEREIQLPDAFLGEHLGAEAIEAFRASGCKILSVTVKAQKT
ncbi:MAG: arsenite methyltransferase [Bacteroidota bacterium]